MGSFFVNDMNRKNTVVIACEMVEDEVRKAMENTGADYPVIWVERGYHNEPDDLREELKVLVRYAETNRIEEDIRTKELTVDPYAAIPESMKTRKQKRTVTTPLYPGNEINGDLENILIVFGLCGKGAEGIGSSSARVIIPRFDDCVNMMLCPEKREKRAYMKAGITYLTRGWTEDKGSLLSIYNECLERYGEKKGRKAFKLMYDSYTLAAVIDDGCYDLEPVEEYARKTSELLGLDTCRVGGSIHVFEKLMSGSWDDDIIVCEPGEVISEENFAFGGQLLDVSTTAM